LSGEQVAGFDLSSLISFYLSQSTKLFSKNFPKIKHKPSGLLKFIFGTFFFRSSLISSVYWDHFNSQLLVMKYTLKLSPTHLAMFAFISIPTVNLILTKSTDLCFFIALVAYIGCYSLVTRKFILFLPS